MQWIIQQPDEKFYLRKLRRILLNGGPNTGKTTSLRTCVGRTVGIVAPKEKGNTSLPFQTVAGNELVAFISEETDFTKPRDWKAEWMQIEKLIVEIVSGKHGPVDTLFIDGLHKLYDIALASICNGANFRAWDGVPEDSIGRKYANAHSLFAHTIDTCLTSSATFVIMACWAGAEVEDKVSALAGDKEAKKKLAYYPDLPGKMSRDIMGEFSIVLSTDVIGMGDASRFVWRTRTQGHHKGAGMKLPLEVKQRLDKKLPSMVEWQDFTKLDAILSTAIREVVAEMKGGEQQAVAKSPTTET